MRQCLLRLDGTPEHRVTEQRWCVTSVKAGGTRLGNYCRMFMGPDYADISRPLVTLTRKDIPFHWTDAHTQAVRHLKQRLIDNTTLQVPDTSKPFELYTDASGYALGGVLEQAGLPIGFLSQAMTPVQQKYSIYDQEMLALVTALDKWSHLLRVGKVTAFTDHQALTHLRKLQTSKPLRGRTARWLDFLVKFPYLTIIYLQGARIRWPTRCHAFLFIPLHNRSPRSAHLRLLSRGPWFRLC